MIYHDLHDTAIERFMFFQSWPLGRKDGRLRLAVANAGDSRAVLGRKDSDQYMTGA